MNLGRYISDKVLFFFTLCKDSCYFLKKKKFKEKCKNMNYFQNDITHDFPNFFLLILVYSVDKSLLWKCKIFYKIDIYIKFRQMHTFYDKNFYYYQQTKNIVCKTHVQWLYCIGEKLVLKKILFHFFMNFCCIWFISYWICIYTYLFTNVESINDF